jgi:NAD(P)-dependent dehydrogenase (short-subunit alcohol dehydrogenase family)
LVPNNSSKAAVTILSDTMHLELVHFNIQVVELNVGTVKSRITEKAVAWKLPPGSLYDAAKVEVEKHMHGDEASDSGFEIGP